MKNASKHETTQQHCNINSHKTCVGTTDRQDRFSSIIYVLYTFCVESKNDDVDTL